MEDRNTAECRECGWEGDVDVLQTYRCPKCGSRKLKTSGSRMSEKENLNPPKGAHEGEDGYGD